MQFDKPFISTCHGNWIRRHGARSVRFGSAALVFHKASCVWTEPLCAPLRRGKYVSLTKVPPPSPQLHQLQKKEGSGNDRCCDCGAPSPQWVRSPYSLHSQSMSHLKFNPPRAPFYTRTPLANYHVLGVAQILHLHLPDVCRHASWPWRPHLLRPIHINGRVQAA